MQIDFKLEQLNSGSCREKPRSTTARVKFEIQRSQVALFNHRFAQTADLNLQWIQVAWTFRVRLRTTLKLPSVDGNTRVNTASPNLPYFGGSVYCYHNMSIAEG